MTEDTVFARSVALDASAVLNERHIGWSGLWSLMGDFVICAQCITAQAIGRVHEPFEHLPDCVAREYSLPPGMSCNACKARSHRCPRSNLH
ncbi:hypothetical protein [Pseudomonas syringae group sp. J309-1]|uniref:hypothetical protein n=1 Tax=Pseudomonas syringae group sp. J309-1 TaxID=3079588 RepID=UPI000F071253|nr:hypothetical protein [Pseudomonas syringae group sp. J309-1]MDU8357266.1 hypothetical protein [Pseudomonas syringae group sp. J309-1]